jgi:hypothetical protein
MQVSPGRVSFNFKINPSLIMVFRFLSRLEGICSATTAVPGITVCWGTCTALFWHKAHAHVDRHLLFLRVSCSFLTCC